MSRGSLRIRGLVESNRSGLAGRSMSLEGNIQKKGSIALTRYEVQSNRAECVADPGAQQDEARVGKIIDLGLTAPVKKR